MNDRALLKNAHDQGRALEAALASETKDARAPKAPLETAFAKALEACAKATDPLIRRLAELAPKVSAELGPRHQMGLMVPIERLLGRSARDEEFLYHETDGDAESEPRLDRIAICENLRSAFNIGAIFRSTEAFGGRAVWLTGYSPDPMKTAMQTDEILETQRFDRTDDAIQSARALGYKIIALENSPGAIDLESFAWPEKSAVVIGNERFGVDSETLAACDHVVRISTRGRKNSVNVGVAFGIAAASWSRAQASSPKAHEDTELLKPIGYVRGGFLNPQVAPRQGAYDDTTLDSTPPAIIELVSRFEGRPSNFSQALRDLDGFERAWIVFGFHESRGWLPQVRPPRGDGTKRGLFATRSPHRPNRLGISSVRIRGVDPANRKIEIAEHDLLEGTPIFDVKPYVPEADSFPSARAGWTETIENDEHEILLSQSARNAISWLESEGETRISGFIHEQLRYQPFDSSRKRIHEIAATSANPVGATHTIAFRTWRFDFKLGPGVGTSVRPVIEILHVRSGYSAEDLGQSHDPYADKDLHRRFLSRTK